MARTAARKCQGRWYKVSSAGGGHYRTDTVKTFIPFGDLIAVLPFEHEGKERGLIMPDEAKGSVVIPRGEVIAAGPECKQVKEGDLVLISNDRPGARFSNDGYEYLMFREAAVWGIIRNEGGANADRDEAGGELEAGSEEEQCLGPGS